MPRRPPMNNRPKAGGKKAAKPKPLATPPKKKTVSTAPLNPYQSAFTNIVASYRAAERIHGTPIKQGFISLGKRMFDKEQAEIQHERDPLFESYEKMTKNDQVQRKDVKRFTTISRKLIQLAERKIELNHAFSTFLGQILSPEEMVANSENIRRLHENSRQIRERIGMYRENIPK